MKSLHLQKMKEGGFAVPDFEVLSFEQLVPAKGQLNRLIEAFAESGYQDIEQWSQWIQETVKKYFVPPDLSEYECDLSAVRSSCNLEDGKDQSFAGIFDSYLNVKRLDIVDAIRSCTQSLYSVKALEYMVLQNMDITTARMNVVLQAMVQADCSGILFTSNPQGVLNEAVITVGRGLGDAVVSDRVKTTTYFYHITDQRFYFDGEDILSSEKLEEIVRIGEKIKSHLQLDYADIEFAIDQDKLYILQARPITGIDDSKRMIYDNSNIVESYPGITLPLTVSFARMIYTGVFKGVAKRILKNKKLENDYAEVLENMVGSINGRMYYQINNWYTLLQFLPMKRKIIPVWQEMLGVREKDFQMEELKLSSWERIRTYGYAVMELIRVPYHMKKLNQRFLEINQYFYAVDRKDISNEQLRLLFQDIREKLLDIWDVTLLNDMFAFIFTGLLKKKFKAKDPINYNEKLMEMISGIQQIESMKPVHALIQLADLWEKEGSSQSFQTQYENFLDIYGDRTMEELKLETETFRTNPELLDDKIREYAGESVWRSSIKQELSFQDSVVQYNRSKKGFYAGNAMRGIENREISRLNRTRIFGMVREIVYGFAENFKREDLIEERKDIFYLTFDEIFETVDHPTDRRDLILQRKADYQNYEDLPAYSRLIMTGQMACKRHSKMRDKINKQDNDLLQGTACSAGTVIGEVAVVFHAKETKNLQDKIIVAKMTDPGWVFLLAKAKGIITEKGSLLSHTAIISRELGIPSIVGVDRVTEILKDDDQVIMDANEGTIRIVR